MAFFPEAWKIRSAGRVFPYQKRQPVIIVFNETRSYFNDWMNFIYRLAAMLSREIFNDCINFWPAGSG
jgi:hypothetical protein